MRVLIDKRLKLNLQGYKAKVVGNNVLSKILLKIIDADVVFIKQSTSLELVPKNEHEYIKSYE